MDQPIFPSSGMSRMYEFLENHMDATEGSCTYLSHSIKKGSLVGQKNSNSKHLWVR